MIEVTITELIEKQSERLWYIGCLESEAQYVVRQPSPDCGDDIYARDLTEQEKEVLSDPLYFSKLGTGEIS